MELLGQLRSLISSDRQRMRVLRIVRELKLRGCDLVSLRVFDVAQGKVALLRPMVMQHKTHRPVQFEITEQTRQSVAA